MSKSIRGILILNNHLLLIKRIKKGNLYYVFPGGHLEEGESFKQACIREFKEETNLEIIPIKKVFVLEESQRHTSIYYLCKIRSQAGKELPKLELIGEEKEKNGEKDYFEPVWMDLSELDNIILHPRRMIPIVKKSLE
ncbi:NUDIX domain-containing protein [Patescibacteria group bacterium]